MWNQPEMEKENSRKEAAVAKSCSWFLACFSSLSDKNIVTHGVTILTISVLAELV